MPTEIVTLFSIKSIFHIALHNMKINIYMYSKSVESTYFFTYLEGFFNCLTIHLIDQFTVFLFNVTLSPLAMHLLLFLNVPRFQL